MWRYLINKFCNFYNHYLFYARREGNVIKKHTHGVTWAIVLLSSVGYFSFQPVLHDWCNNGRGMCYPVSGMVHIKEPLLLLEKSSLCGGSGFPFSLSEWSLTICLTPYNRKYNVLSASLNKTFHSFLWDSPKGHCKLEIVHKVVAAGFLSLSLWSDTKYWMCWVHV